MRGGRIYTHAAFRDVCFYLKKAFYIKEKGKWKLSILWLRRKDLAEYYKDSFYATTEKLKEFKEI